MSLYLSVWTMPSMQFLPMQNIHSICAHTSTRNMGTTEENLGTFFSVLLQWKFYVNSMRKACPENGLITFRENYHLSALFRQRLGNLLEPQAPTVLDIV